MKPCIVVGAGLAGCTMAYLLRERGYAVTVYEKSQQVGGLCRDERWHGTLYSVAGPHIFHTKDDEVWEFANRFTGFNGYVHRIGVEAQGRTVNWPLAWSDFPGLPQPSPVAADTSNLETYALSIMGEVLYERYVLPYTLKQWDVQPRDLPASLGKRFRVTETPEPVFGREHQGYPNHGFMPMFQQMLYGCTVTVGKSIRANEVQAFRGLAIITAPLDQFFGYQYGRLKWVGHRFGFRFGAQRGTQPYAVVNTPEDPVVIRKTDFGDITMQGGSQTVLCREWFDANTRHYPFPGRDELQKPYQQECAKRDWHPIGRLATYRYLNMDLVIRQCLDLAEKL